MTGPDLLCEVGIRILSVKMTGNGVIFCDRLCDGSNVRADGHGFGAAWMEPAAAGRRDQIGRRPRDAGQLPLPATDRREGTHQPDRVWMQRIVEEFARWCLLDDLACIHDQNSV